MSIECYLVAVDFEKAEALAKDPMQGVRLRDLPGTQSCCVHKAWHAIHFLLTGCPEEGTEPGCFLLHGGTPLGLSDSHEMEDQPRLLSPDQVKAFDNVLKPLDEAGLKRRYDHDALVDADIYSIAKDDPTGEMELVEHYLIELRGFIAESAEKDCGVVVSIG